MKLEELTSCIIENAAIAAAEIANFYMYFGAGKVFIPVHESSSVWGAAIVGCGVTSIKG